MINLGRVEREHQAKLGDWERKREEWKGRVDALDRKKMNEIEKVAARSCILGPYIIL